MRQILALLLLLTASSCPRVVPPHITSSCGLVSTTADRQRVVSLYAGNGLLDVDPSDEHLMRSFLGIALDQDLPAGTYDVNPRAPVSAGLLSIYLLKSDPCHAFGYGPGNATYASDLDAVFIDSELVRDVSAAIPGQLGEQSILKFILLHELGHRAKDRDAGIRSFDWVDLRFGPSSDAASQARELKADEYAANRFIATTPGSWKQVTDELLGLGHFDFLGWFASKHITFLPDREHPSLMFRVARMFRTFAATSGIDPVEAAKLTRDADGLDALIDALSKNLVGVSDLPEHLFVWRGVACKDQIYLTTPDVVIGMSKADIHRLVRGHIFRIANQVLVDRRTEPKHDDGAFVTMYCISEKPVFIEGWPLGNLLEQVLRRGASADDRRMAFVWDGHRRIQLLNGKLDGLLSDATRPESFLSATLDHGDLRVYENRMTNGTTLQVYPVSSLSSASLLHPQEEIIDAELLSDRAILLAAVNRIGDPRLLSVPYDGTAVSEILVSMKTLATSISFPRGSRLILIGDAESCVHEVELIDPVSGSDATWDCTGPTLRPISVKPGRRDAKPSVVAVKAGGKLIVYDSVGGNVLWSSDYLARAAYGFYDPDGNILFAQLDESDVLFVLDLSAEVARPHG